MNCEASSAAAMDEHVADVSQLNRKRVWESFVDVEIKWACFVLEMAMKEKRQKNIPFPLLVLIKCHKNHSYINSKRREEEEEAIVVRDGIAPSEKLYSFDFFEQFNKMTSSSHSVFILNNGHLLLPLLFASEWTNSFGIQKTLSPKKKVFCLLSPPKLSSWVCVREDTVACVFPPKIESLFKRSRCRWNRHIVYGGGCLLIAERSIYACGIYCLFTFVENVQ